MNTAAQACDRAGVSYRQFDFWVRRGWIGCVDGATPGSGIPRYVSDSEVRVLTLMGGLVRAGIRPDVAGAMARDLLEKGSLHVTAHVTMTWDGAL